MLPEPREAPLLSSTFRLTAGDPAHVHLTTTYVGKSIQVHTEGIYSLTEDVLTYCVAAPGHPCPRSFTTVAGDDQTLVVLKRLGPSLAVLNASQVPTTTTVVP